MEILGRSDVGLQWHVVKLVLFLDNNTMAYSLLRIPLQKLREAISDCLRI
jgi:hypothetical protein